MEGSLIAEENTPRVFSSRYRAIGIKVLLIAEFLPRDPRNRIDWLTRAMRGSAQSVSAR
jgi:hypothetical protein